MSASFRRAGSVFKRGSRAVARWLTRSSLLLPLARKVVAIVLIEALAISTVATTAAGANLPVHDESAGIFTVQQLASRLAQSFDSSQAQSSSHTLQTPPVELASLTKPKTIRRAQPPVRPLVQTSNVGLAVSVAFADSSSPSSNFPVPWQGPSNITFVGGGVTFRAGAMRLDNTTGSDVVVDKVTVNLGRPGPTFQLWSNFTVPASGSAILTQTADNNFNTSAASPIVTCGQPLAQGETRIPTITVTIGGKDFPFTDTAHVLDTGGFDSSCRGNQSLAWRPIGTTGLERPAATLHLSSENAPHDVGTSTTFTATLTDAADQPLANAPVGLNVLNGPNVGKSANGTTDAFGAANIQYSSTAQGVDLAQATITNASTGTLKSEQASTTWTSADSCSVPAPAASASRLIYVGQTAGSFGDQLRVAALLTDGTGVPLTNRPLAFSVGGNSPTATTDSNGVAGVTVAPGIGQTPVAISFAGDANFSAAQTTTSVTIQAKASLLRYTGNNLLGSAGAQPVSALLTDALGQTPIANRTVTFAVGATQVSAITDANGNASGTITFPASQAVGPAQLTISFAGDADYKSSSRVVPIDIFLVTSFVIWGGNAGGLKIGNHVNFFGPRWEDQVKDGAFRGGDDFKGFAQFGIPQRDHRNGDDQGPPPPPPVTQIQQCQASAGRAVQPGCWFASDEGHAPKTLPGFIEVIVSTAVNRSDDSVFGNTACGVVLKVDPPKKQCSNDDCKDQGGDDGNKGRFGTIIAVNGDCAGVFPKPAILTAKQTQVTPVLPQQQVPISASISNSGATDASNATLNETFDGLIPASATQSFTTISAGQSVSATFQTSVPAIPARQSAEAGTDYETRLGGLDGRLFTASGELTFTDIFQQLYQPLDFSSFSTLQIPRLSVGVTGPACIVPGAQVPYQFTISNIGSATATQGLATVTLPDGTTQNVAVPKILPSAAFAGTVQWKAPVIKAKDPAETTAAYLARLALADNVTVPATTASVNWQDAQSNQYGAVDGQVSSVKERLPIISLTPAAPATVLPNQAASANFAVTNTGGGNAIQANILIKQQGRPDIVVPAFSLPAGQSATPTGILRLPSIPLEGPQETDAQYLSRLQALDNQKLLLDANLSWSDKAGNLYGPTSNPFSTTEVLPILTVAATGPATAKPADNVAYTLTLQNIGHADAATLNITVTLPDGSVQHPLAATAALAGATIQATVNFTVPKTQPAGPAVAKIRVGWTDAAGNTYGFESATVSTNIISLAITDFTPKLGPTGTAVSILGTGLSSSAGPTTVSFVGPNGSQLPAKINFVGPTQLAVVVPDTAVTGVIQVATPNGSASTAMPFTVGSRQDFTVTVAPGTATVPQSSTTSLVVAVTSPQTSFTQMASLSVTGLPQGVATAFTPAQITAGASSTLALDLSAVDLQPGSYSFTVHAKTNIDGKPQDRTATATLNVIPAGQTTLAGQVISTSNEPIVGATVSLDGQSVLTDTAGRFFLVGIQAGTNRALSVDGHSAFSPNATFPLIFEPATVIAGRANVIPNPFHLPPIDTSQEVTIDPTRDTVAGNAAVQNLQMTIPKGAHLRTLDGTLVTRTSITPLAPDRTPAPLPSDVGTNLVYTSQPGGAITDIPIPVVYPNLAGLNPGTRVELYAFDHAHVNWFVYGFGRVSTDGRTIAPEINPATGKSYGLPDFSWHFPNTGPNGNPGPPPEQGGCPKCRTKNPVDLSTGMKIEEVPLVSWGGARGGIDFSLVYTTDKAATCIGSDCPFGNGWTHNWDIRLSGSFAPGGAGRLIMPEELTGRLYSFSGTDSSGGARFSSIATTSGLASRIIVTASQPTQYRQGDGTVLSFNSAGRLITKVDRNGNTTTLTYSGDNLTQITDPVGRSLTFTYDGSARVTSMTDPPGRRWTYTYGGVAGIQLTSITDPAGNVTQYAYNGARLVSVIDPRGNTVKQISYNSNGRVATQTFADGGTETYSYLLSGTIVTGTTIVDPLGNTRSMRFSGANYVIGAVDELGQSHAYNRTLTTNLAASTTGPCNCTETTSQYDTSGNLLAETDLLGNTMSYQYGPVFNLMTQRTDKLGNTTVNTYDLKGNLLSVTNALNEATTYSYDIFGRLISVTDPLGHKIQREYDTNGYLSAIIDPLGNRTTFQYDILGRKISLTDPLNRQQTWQYDALSRVIAETDSAGAATRYSYDANGNQINKTDALGHSWTTGYDAKNRAISETDPLGHTTRYHYDSKDQLVATIVPGGQMTTMTYDPRGKLTASTDQAGGVTSYIYDSQENLTKLTDSRGNSTTFTYDSLYRLVNTTDPVGNATVTAYDANNNMIQTVDRLGRSTNTTFDTLNRVSAKSFADATLSYRYDSAGRLIHIDDTSSSLLRTYDKDDRLISETQASGTVQYTYDASGKRQTMIVADRPAVTYTYDAAGRLSTINQGPETFTYGYDSLSRLISLQRPNDIPTSYQYDAANRLTRLIHGVNGSIENFGYTYTLNDQIAAVSSLASAMLVPMSEVTAPTDPTNREMQFGAESFIFNNEGQTVDRHNAQGDSQYLWDARGRLLQVILPTGQAVTYGYDAMGRRIARTAAGLTTHFLYDKTDVVLDLNNDGSTIDYLNGPGLDHKLRQVAAGAGPLYFLQDHLGSTIALTDKTGSIAERDQYEPYGANQGNALTRYLYTGREFDPVTGLLYYRARYYDAGLGRFISEDPIGFASGNNFYEYVSGDPIDNLDPTGCGFIDCAKALKELADAMANLAKRLAENKCPDPGHDKAIQQAVNRVENALAKARTCLDPETIQKIKDALRTLSIVALIAIIAILAVLLFPEDLVLVPVLAAA